jgi:parallel beta-helix repeat protein
MVQTFGFFISSIIVISSILSAPFGRAATFYVATTGNDRDLGTEVRPFRSINKGVSILKPGDTLYVKTGTYEESLINVIPGGKSWKEPVRLAVYPGHTVTIKPKIGSRRVLHLEGLDKKYIVVDGFIFDAINVSSNAIKITYESKPEKPASQIRIENSEVKNAINSQGILVTEGSDGNEFINVTVHDNGSHRLNHGLYIGSRFNLVEGCHVYNNQGHGIQVYSGTHEKPNNNTVRRNRVHNNQIGIGLYGGVNNSAHNNIVYSNVYGIIAKNQRSGLYNNTIYKNNEGGIYVEASGAIVANNIAYNNAGYGIRIEFSSNVKVNNNLLSNNVAGDFRSFTDQAVLRHNLIGKSYDPKFIDLSNFDFRLSVSSSAVDNGATIPEVPIDLAGVRRPKGRAYDIGAYESY